MIKLAKICPIAIILSLCHGPISLGADQPQPAISLSGYKLEQFGDFERNWHLVTVRYRKDTSEMRFTYANPAAWDVLSQNRTEYPDGATFAKIAVMTQTDISFPSSMVPSGARRIQFMVRDKKKHAETDGWGYELFDSTGKVFPGEPKTQVIACAACHRLVKDRGEVFSQPMSKLRSMTPSWKESLKFEDYPFSLLPEKLKNVLPKNTKTVRALSGNLNNELFFGSLDEIQPLLAQEVSHTHLASVIFSGDKKQFSAVYPGNNLECESQSHSLAMVGLHSLPNETGNIYVSKFCQEPNP